MTFISNTGKVGMMENTTSSKRVEEGVEDEDESVAGPSSRVDLEKRTRSVLFFSHEISLIDNLSPLPHLQLSFRHSKPPPSLWQRLNHPQELAAAM